MRIGPQLGRRPFDDLMIRMLLGEQLKALRTAKRMSLQDVADAAGISRSHVWNLETGAKTNPSVELLVKLAELFRVGIAELVGEDPDAKSEEPEMVALHRNLKDLNPRDREIVQAMIDKMRDRKGDTA